MKRQNVLLLLAFFVVVYLSAGQADLVITAAKKPNAVELSCKDGTWENDETMLSLVYDDAKSGSYKCTQGETERRILVRIRNCENCMEVNALSLTAIVIGNVLATALVGWAVYTISAQPKSKNISRSKASDRVNLINNGDGSTYQELNAGDRSEYSRLGGVRQK